MIRRVVRPILAGLLLLPAWLPAQSPPGVDPGGVATVVAGTGTAVDAPARFEVRPAPGVRVFGPTRGEILPSTGFAGIPLTLGVPADAPAGPLRLATVLLYGGGGGAARDSIAVRELDVVVQVRARHVVRFWLGAETVTAPAGDVIEVGYRLWNAGNTPETLGLELRAPSGWEQAVTPAVAQLEPGDSAAGVIRLAAPRDARAGVEHVVRLVASGGQVREARHVRAVVVSAAPPLGGLAHVPATVFAGSSTGAGGAGVGISAEGSVGSGLRLSLVGRYAEPGSAPPSFQGQLSGPRLLVGLQAERWRIRLGDVAAPFDLLTGPLASATGVTAEVERGRLAAHVIAGAPASFGYERADGHLVRGETRFTTRAGVFGLRGSTLRRSSELTGSFGSLGGTAFFSGRRGPHAVDAELGVARLHDDSAAATGFAGEARYRLELDGGNLLARVRTVPGSTRQAGTLGREAFVSGRIDLMPGIAFTGWGFTASSPSLDDQPYTASDGGAAGLRLATPRVSGQALGVYRRTRRVGGGAPTTTARTVRLSVGVPTRWITLESDGEFGRRTGPAGSPYVQLRTGARWTRRHEWALLGLSYLDQGGDPEARLDLAGALRLRAIQLQGGLNLRLTPGAGEAASLWSTGSVEVIRGTRLSLGLDYGPAVPGGDWRLSMGISRDLSLPLPIPRQPAIRGVVFVDSDGDGRRDAGEATVPDVTLVYGPIETATDAGGAYRFDDPSPASLRVDQSSLPVGLMVRPDLYLPDRGTADVPLVPTAALVLRLFLDRDDDEERDPAEDVAAGAVVSLIDADGRSRDAAAASDGSVTFSGLPPGPYTLVVRLPGARRLDAAPFRVQVRLEPRQVLRRTIAVPLRSREIRMQGGTMPDPAGAPDPPAQSSGTSTNDTSTAGSRSRPGPSSQR